MLQTILETFSPSSREPLLVAFINHLTQNDYSSAMDFGFWDFYVYNEGDDPFLAVKTIKNSLTKDDIFRISTAKTPQKVVLVEGDAIGHARFDSLRLFLASLGVGLYIRDVGWYTYPHYPYLSVPEDLVFRLASRWYQDSEGQWLKDCSKCHVPHSTDGFYRAANPRARDPYRNVCKTCFNGS